MRLHDSMDRIFQVTSDQIRKVLKDCWVSQLTIYPSEATRFLNVVLLLCPLRGWARWCQYFLLMYTYIIISRSSSFADVIFFGRTSAYHKVDFGCFHHNVFFKSQLEFLRISPVNKKKIFCKRSCCFQRDSLNVSFNGKCLLLHGILDTRHLS